MKAIGLPPSDPRVRQMNDAQWLWCYFNEVQDQQDESDAWKSRFDYLTYFINYDMAKRVHEAEQGKKQGSKYKQEGLHKNHAFDMEAKAASLGYNPADGISVEEFLSNLEKEKQKNSVENNVPDIMNDSFEDLLASGGFVEVADAEQGIGDANESLDDFLDRAFEYENQLVSNRQQNDVPIGIDESDWEMLNNPNVQETNVEKTREQKLQEELDMDLDLDFFDFDDE